MNYWAWLDILAQLATILTAGVAFYGYGKYVFERFRKRRMLETYLKKQKGTAKDSGQRSLMHLAARLSMSEQDVMDAAFRSSRIVTRLKDDNQGFADRMMLEYEEEKLAQRRMQDGAGGSGDSAV